MDISAQKMNISAANSTYPDLYINPNIDLSNVREIEAILLIIMIILLKMLIYLLFVNILRKRNLLRQNNVSGHEAPEELCLPRADHGIPGFPPPGHDYWTEQTLEAVEARYKPFGIDMTPYYEAVNRT